MTDILEAWAPLYVGETFPYLIDGSDATYRRAAELLTGMSTEDWGAGTGWMRRYHQGPYLAVDGTKASGCDVVADLTRYRSETDAVLLRHVLEHNERWPSILANAVASARKRLVIVLYTPLQDETRRLQPTGLEGVPEIGFALRDITDRLGPVSIEHIGSETVIVADDPAGLSRYINKVKGIKKKRYLELGVYGGATLRAVTAKVKVGVDSDPLAVSTHCMTTDEFFGDNARQFDVVLIDADHHFESVLKDFNNACRVLAPGGVIFVHDLVPPDESYVAPEATREDGHWCGDGYKLLDLAKSRGVAFTVLDEPFGLTRFDDPRPLG